jgi:hypothetical protein
MNTQTLLNPLIVFAPTDLAPAHPVLASSRDYGFDCDEEEIARETLAPLPASLSAQSMTQADADEFDFDNLWFLS